MASKTSASLQFLGAAGTVTGSRYLIESNGERILVDAGLFQGYKGLRERNRAPFPVSPNSIDIILLTHAHLDHSGYIPALVRNGFKGKVVCTPATAELCSLLLLDSAHLLEDEAKFAARKRFARHEPPVPLYTVADAERAMEHFETAEFESDYQIGHETTGRFIHAGHLLGASQISLTVGGKVLHFSGDLGRQHDALMRPPAPFYGADILVCESTYGDRTHPRSDPEAELSAVIRRVAHRGGVILIPAFAVGRAQGLMLHIARLKARGAIPQVPLFLNSPMAIDATDIYHRYHDEHHVSDEECLAMFHAAKIVRSTEESKALNTQRGPMIIISASGMLTGGRILHHLRAFAPDPRNAILLSGFQAGGTRGAALAQGAQSLRVFGEDVAVNAEVVQLDSLSGHADADELISWMRQARQSPETTYLTHGEPKASDALRSRVTRELSWNVRVPDYMDRVDIGSLP
jgi:metallo-beta-lactamase family protein